MARVSAHQPLNPPEKHRRHEVSRVNQLVATRSISRDPVPPSWFDPASLCLYLSLSLSRSFRRIRRVGRDFTINSVVFETRSEIFTCQHVASRLVTGRAALFYFYRLTLMRIGRVIGVARAGER